MAKGGPKNPTFFLLKINAKLPFGVLLARPVTLFANGFSAAYIHRSKCVRCTRLLYIRINLESDFGAHELGKGEGLFIAEDSHD